MEHNFGEKKEEKLKGQVLPVWQSPKYTAAKDTAIKIIESKKYGLRDSDFWILMNSTKTGKMAYSGLILSHNGCLKINDSLQSKFVPSCVTCDKSGYRESLVYTYTNDEQGIYEVGEASQDNCDNSYVYAMAYKRLFDRVVLKLSKLAYDGIYSDSESDEFGQQLDSKEKAITLVSSDIIKQITELGTPDRIASALKYYKVDAIEDLSALDAAQMLRRFKIKNEAKDGWEIKP